MDRQQHGMLAIGIGLVLVVTVSLLEGVSGAFFHMIAHLQEDFGPELGIHLYILGWILVIYGSIRLLLRKEEQS